MGFYITKDSKGEPLPKFGKAEALLADGATEVNGVALCPHMVCVCRNPDFEVAAFAYNRGEFIRFKYDGTDRPKRWFSYVPGTQPFIDKYPELIEMTDSLQPDTGSELEQVIRHLGKKRTAEGDGFTILRLD
jgi:hypothetical protein